MKSGGANCDFYYATAGHRVKRAAPGGSLWYSITRSSGRAGPSTEDVVRNIHIAHVCVSPAPSGALRGPPPLSVSRFVCCVTEF